MQKPGITLGLSDLERRLEPRRAAERLHHRGKLAHGRGDFMLRHKRIVQPALRAAFQIAGLYSRGMRNALQPVVTEVKFGFPELPRRLEGFRILHLSDLHIDALEGLAERTAAIIREIPADLCVLTGDYRYEVEGPCNKVYPRMETVLRSVRAKHGTLGILGNHDEADIALRLADMGVRMLINDAVETGGLWTVGVDDAHYYGCDDLSSPLREVPADAFKLLLAHTPELYREAAAAGIDLYLCGHTHAGQVRLPGIGMVLQNARCPRNLAAGRWRHGGTQGYTSAGIGCSMLPIRLNCPPEIVLIELARAE